MPSRPTVDTEIAELLHSVGRRIRRSTGAEFEPMGLTPAQVRAMRILARADGPLRMSEVAERLRIARRSATSVIDDLVALGHVQRSSDADDRRSVLVTLTRSGREALERIESRRRAVTSRLLGCLDRDDRVALRDLLRRLDEAPD